jgi:hypothetical protein
MSTCATRRVGRLFRAARLRFEFARGVRWDFVGVVKSVKSVKSVERVQSLDRVEFAGADGRCGLFGVAASC